MHLTTGSLRRSRSQGLTSSCTPETSRLLNSKSPRPPPSSQPSGSTAAGEGPGFYAHRQGPPKARAAGHTGAGPRYLALGCSQFLTREAAWGQKGEQGGQWVCGWPRTQEGWLGTCRKEAQLLAHPLQVGSAPCDQGPLPVSRGHE